MASMTREPHGGYQIQFLLHRKRKSLRLGIVTEKRAEAIKLQVEQMAHARKAGVPYEPELRRWLQGIDDKLHAKLARAELVEPRPKATPQTVVKLGAFLQEYIDGRTDVKPLTTRHLKDAKRNLVQFFGDDKPLADITPGDADDFRRSLLKRLGDNTVRRQCGRAKQFFRAAVRKRLIAENPFADMKGCGVQPNRARDYFVSREAATKVLDACPDVEWQLIFALSRYGGLRCPSEHLALRWADVNWAESRMLIRSSKTEHHAGGESRLVPIFPELRPYLDEAWELAVPGAEYIIARYRDTNANLRTHLKRIIAKAGLEPWPKLFQNLRASRATELAKDHAAHVAAAWLGHSTLVANKHYWQVTDADFAKALSGGGKAVQKTVQNSFDKAGKSKQAASTAQQKTPVLPGFSDSCDYLHECTVPPHGLEP